MTAWDVNSAPMDGFIDMDQYHARTEMKAQMSSSPEKYHQTKWWENVWTWQLELYELDALPHQSTE